MLPHLDSNLDAGLNNGACTMNVDPLKQRAVITAGGWRGTVEDQGHILESWQQSLWQNKKNTSVLFTAALEEYMVQARATFNIFQTAI